MLRTTSSRARMAALVGAAIVCSLPASAQGPILHEYYVPDPADDLRLSATTPDGELPAAIDTPSGVVGAPEPYRSTDIDSMRYGGSSTPDSADAGYRIDRNTAQPDLVSYDDPFIPSIAPFKRLYAYDRLAESLELVVGDRSLRPVPIGGHAGDGDDQFYADLVVDLVDGVPVRIPSVGPQTKIIAARLEPPAPFQVLSDGADNWFIRTKERRRARLVLGLAIPRSVFGSPFADVAYSELEAKLWPVPESVRPDARAVLAELGLSHALEPKEALRQLVRHFRSFAPSDDLPSASSGAKLYRELALTRKGVCRHRAYAFMITALELGLPTRLVRNEAHAWVEVWDGVLWHRIDLGGAAGRMDLREESAEHAHRPPSDPYVWPESAQAASGQEMAERSRAGGGANPRGGLNAPTHSGPLPSPPPPTPAEVSELVPTDLVLAVGQHDVRRGEALEVRGTARAGSSACPHARVDILLESLTGERSLLGALATDAQGAFAGSVTVPPSAAVGRYRLHATTDGVGRCGPGRSR